MSSCEIFTTPCVAQGEVRRVSRAGAAGRCERCQNVKKKRNGDAQVLALCFEDLLDVLQSRRTRRCNTSPNRRTSASSCNGHGSRRRAEGSADEKESRGKSEQLLARLMELANVKLPNAITFISEIQTNLQRQHESTQATVQNSACVIGR